jgi:hypothetical protein
MNRFLYITAHSAHPQGVTKSLIYGLLSTYFRQNSRRQDFYAIVRLLFKRLRARGHQRDVLTPIFLNAISTITSKRESNRSYKQVLSTKKTSRLEKENQVFFHLPFHPRGITRTKIQTLYKETCKSPDNLEQDFHHLVTDTGDHLRISKLTIAYSWCKNIRDSVSPSRIQEFEDCKVSHFL